MSQQRRGQEEAVGARIDLCVIQSVLILLPFTGTLLSAWLHIRQVPSPPLFFIPFLDGDQVDRLIGVKQPSAALAEHKTA